MLSLAQIVHIIILYRVVPTIIRFDISRVLEKLNEDNMIK